MSLTVQGKDTCTFLKGTISDVQNRISRWYILGYISHNFTRHIVSNSSSESEVIKKGDEVRYLYKLNPVPIVIDGLDSIEFRLMDRDVDSVVFSYKGKELLAYSKPTSLVFSNDTLIWQKQNLFHAEDTLSFKVFFEGTNKGIFAMSRFTLQDKDKGLNFNELLRSFLLMLPFWFLFYILLKHRKLFEPKFTYQDIDSIIKWLPILSCFYMTILLSEILCYFDRTGLFRAYGYDVTEDRQILQNRFIVLIASILLLLLQHFIFRKRIELGITITKKIISVIAWSGISLLVFGLINFLAESIFSGINKQSFAQSMRLVFNFRYLPIFNFIGGMFFLLSLYKLFSFNKKYKWIACGISLIVMIIEIIIFFPSPQTIETQSRTVSAYLDSIFTIEVEFLFTIPGLLLLILLDKVTYVLSAKKNILFSITSLIFLFCLYSTYSLFDYFLGIPATLIVAFILCRYFLILTPKKLIHLLPNEKSIFELDKLDRKIFTKIFELKQFEKVKEKYKDKLLKGELLPAEFDKANRDLENKISEAVPAGIDRILIHKRMHFPLHESHIKNGEHAMTYSAIISFLLLLFYYLIFPISYWKSSTTNFTVFDLTFFVFIPCLPFIISSFCLGYFFIYIKGDSGWKKGFYIGLTMVVARLPYQYLVSDKLTVMFFLFPIMKDILIMTLIGFFAFDYATVKKIYGKNFTLKHLAQIEGWQNLIWFASIILSAIGAAVTAWFTGNISSILENVTK